jgi:hypothetical protein
MDTLRGLLGGNVFDTPAHHRNMPLRSLWATSSVHLNDSEEFVRGRDVINSKLASLPSGKIGKQMKLALKDADALEVYCACFSAVDDDLSQWRGYGDNGSGVCLAYNLADLLEKLDGIGYWVIYGKPGEESVQGAVAAGLVRYIHDAIEAALPSLDAPEAVYREVREQLTEIWPTLCLAFKHSDFANEKEFRILYSDAVGRRPLSPSFRPNPLIPFVKLQMSDGERVPLLQVRLGPAISSDVNVRSTRLALASLAIDKIKVVGSGIPYVPR